MTDTPLSASAARAAARYLDSWLAFRRDRLRVPGVQAAVLADDELVLSSAYGQADVEHDVALRADHLFRIASHSKTFTATAVFQLVQAGLLRCDDTLGFRLPWIAGSSLASVTIRELLAHGAGVIRDGRHADFWQLSTAFPDVDELRAIAADDAATLAPNVRFKYSNIGFSLLGAVVEAVSGMSYNRYVTENVIDKLDLRDSYPEYCEQRARDYAVGYSALSYADMRIPIDHVDTRAMSAATGFTSTAADVCHYAAAHFRDDDRLLSENSKRLMQRTEWEVENSESQYGLGFEIDTVGEHRLVGHGGGYPGHATRTFFDPVGRVAISVLTNAIDGPAQPLATGVVKLIDLAAAPVQEPVDESADRFCGRFANLWGVLDVVRLDRRLVGISPAAEDPAAAPMSLAVVDERTLRVTDASGSGGFGETIDYEFDGDAIRAVRGAGGVSLAPIEDFAATVSALPRVTRGDLFAAGGR